MKKFSILIPFHHRMDLLIPLLESLSEFSVLVVDDGVDDSVFPNPLGLVQSIRTTGEVGFTKAVNLGLNFLRIQNVDWVLLLNDDAKIDAQSIYRMLELAQNHGAMVSPMIQCLNHRYYGVRVHRWGRVKINTKPEQRLDALLGVCLLFSTAFSLDNRFIHGFEDIELTWRAKQQGVPLIVDTQSLCYHIGGASLSPKSQKGQYCSVFGHLQMYDSILKSPIILALTVSSIISDQCLEINKSNLKERMKGTSVGFVDWIINSVVEFR